MENASEALKMAAAILIFVIALATSFSVFGTTKQTADSIIGMRNRQKYLEAPDLNGILYTSSGDSNEALGITDSGDRIVSKADVISTIYRYHIEKYNVTIIKDNKVVVRYDSNIEAILKKHTTDSNKEQIKDFIADRIANSYVKNTQVNIDEIYGNINVFGNYNDIETRINKDLSNINEQLTGKKIIEVTKEIDNSKYLKDDNKVTNLLQQYEMPTIEIIYIVQ